MLLDALCRLHRLAHLAVSGQAAWPASEELCESVWQMLALLHVTEEDSDGIIRFAHESARAELDLLLACIGAIEVWEIPFYLQEHGYASEQEALDVWEAETEAKAYRLLKLLIFRGYQNNVRNPKTHANNVFDLRGILGRSVGREEAKPAKKRRKANSQIEMLLPIVGKKQTRETTAKWSPR